MATTTSIIVETRQQPPKKTIVGDELDKLDELPRPILQRSTTIHNPSPGFSHRHRHSKKLSLNFPIAVPVPIAYDPSVPMTANGSISSISQSPSITSPYRNGTPTTGTHMHAPMLFPHETGEEVDGPDFLTLIASQERRVMELKEELIKAESGLLELKKQWGIFENRKKAAELRSKPTRPGSAKSKSTEGGDPENDEVERMKRREAREKERKMRDLALKEAAAAGIERLGSNASGGKGKGGRVFAGGHTRTLSLLQNTNVSGIENVEGETQQKSRSESSPVANESPTNDPDESIKKQPRKSISRQPTLQELIATSATGAAQLNFGKTYKDLAQAGRKSLPPGTDDLVKQGKQVYDGINQGFWNFVEDIRQATVGDEAVNGPPPVEQRREVRQKRSNKKLATDNSCEKHGKNGSKAENKKKGKSGDDLKSEKDNFWKEFGLETPKGAKNKPQPAKRNKENQAPVKDHESKSSTDSKCPPSLLDDLEDEEAWDNWPTESPQAQRRTEPSVNIRNDSEDDSEEEITAEARKAFNRRLQAKRPAGNQASWTDLMS